MTTEELAAFFPAGVLRPDPWKPGALREYAAARNEALAIERRADDLFATVMDGDKAASREAATVQAVDWLDRLAWAKAREAAATWIEGEA